jgi:hypothetical protein
MLKLNPTPVSPIWLLILNSLHAVRPENRLSTSTTRQNLGEHQRLQSALIILDERDLECSALRLLQPYLYELYQ